MQKSQKLLPLICLFSISLQNAACSPQSGQLRSTPKDENSPHSIASKAPLAANAKGETPQSTTSGGAIAGLDTAGTEVALDAIFRKPGGPDKYLATTLTFGSEPGSNLRGYYVRPGGALSAQPALMVLHGLAGLNDPFKKMLQWFVGQGYAVFAPDLFNGAVPSSRTNGVEMQSALEAQGNSAVLSMISQAGNFLFTSANATALGIIGWDAGGRWAINAGLTLPDLFVAGVNFYGDPSLLQSSSSIIQSSFMSVAFKNDPDLTYGKVAAVEAHLKNKGLDVTFVTLEKATPGFLDPSRNPKFFDEIAVDPQTTTSPPDSLRILRETMEWLHKPLFGT